MKPIGVEPVYALIGARISAARERRGLSQMMLAASLQPQLTRAAVCNMDSAGNGSCCTC